MRASVLVDLLYSAATQRRDDLVSVTGLVCSAGVCEC